MRIRNKPEHERRRIAYWVMTVVAGLLIGVWFVSFFFDGSRILSSFRRSTASFTNSDTVRMEERSHDSTDTVSGDVISEDERDLTLSVSREYTWGSSTRSTSSVSDEVGPGR